jgi:hypothetical protein
LKTKNVRLAAGVGASALALVGISAGVSFADDKPAPPSAADRSAASAADRFLGIPAPFRPPWSPRPETP